MVVWDIETNGLLDNVSVGHCICAYDITNETKHEFRPDEFVEGTKFLLQALKDGRQIVGHNIIGYDIPALEKITGIDLGERAYRSQIVDTLVLSRLIYPNVKQYDFGLMKKGLIPGRLAGTHTLAAWGYRLGELKGEYGQQEGDVWAVFNEEMLEYCMQDVMVNVKMYLKFLEQNYSPMAITLEHEAQWLMCKQERNGFPFKKEDAEKLEGTLRAEYATYSADLVANVEPIPDKVFVPKRDNKRLGYKAGVPIQRYKEFNPNSRQQIEYVLKERFKYLPEDESLYDIPDNPDDSDIDFREYRLKMDDITFKFISEDESASEEVQAFAKRIEKVLMLKKRLGQLADGNVAWLKFYKEETGCIHGRVIANGTVTGRATHSSPNVAQVPSVRAEYGKDCRSLFNASKQGNGWVQAGIDASGLELRCLAHYMAQYDNGEYGEIILNGDIHTHNQEAAKLPTRDNAKTFIYATLYGAGDGKIGQIVGGDKTAGKRLKKNFYTSLPALKELMTAIDSALVVKERGRVVRWLRKYLKGLDGRLLWVRSPHSALNLLLQACGAVICKKWIVETERLLVEEYGLKHGWDGDFAFMAWVHDEIQLSCKDVETAELCVKVSQEAMRNTEKFFNFRIQLDTEGKIGKDWMECH